MAESNGGEARSGIAKAFGLKGKASTLPPITDEELHEEALTRAISGSREMRKEIMQWRGRAEAAEAELVSKTREFDVDMRALQHDNDSLRKQLSDLGQKHEFYLRKSLELTTKCADLEMFVAHELTRIHESTQQDTLTMIAMINNTGTMLNDGAKRLSESVTNAVATSAKNLRAFLDDMHKRAADAEFAPRTGPKPPAAVDDSLLTEEQEAELKSLAARLAPKSNEG